MACGKREMKTAIEEKRRKRKIVKEIIGNGVAAKAVKISGVSAAISGDNGGMTPMAAWRKSSENRQRQMAAKMAWRQPQAKLSQYRRNQAQ
jgi:hypothetical protein